MKTIALMIMLPQLLFAESAQDLNRRGAEVGEQKRYDEAIELFSRSAAAYDAESARYYHNKGWLHELQGDPERAFQLYERAVQLNPLQPESLERLGFHYFRKGNYAKSIELGEKAAGLNPSVPNLKDWLPEAYRRGLETAALKRIEEENVKKQEETPNSIGVTSAAEADKLSAKPELKRIGINADVVLRYGYDVRNEGAPFYVDTPGVITNIPFTIGMWFQPNDFFRVVTTLENPYWGAVTPQIVGQQEFLEATFMLGTITVGAGMWFTHYSGEEAFGRKMTLSDMKMGFIAGHTSAESESLLRLYPRLLPSDTRQFSDGKTLDCALYEFTHRYFIEKTMSYYSRLSEYDFTLFDHDVPVSHYWGFFEIALGFSLDFGPLGVMRGGSFYIEYAKRFNLRSLNESKPYAFLNGQGYLGFDRDGDPEYFNGYRSTSNILRIGASQSITESTFVYQKLYLEIVDRHEKRQELALRVGGGVML
jgi:hypothetical protein